MPDDHDTTIACRVCNGEPYAAFDGEQHTDVCPGCGVCSGYHGGEPTHPEGIRVAEERAEAIRARAEEEAYAAELRALEESNR
jgi:hypothetical protein